MAELSSILYSSTLPRLGVEPSLDGGLRSWVIKGTFEPSSTSSTGEVKLDRVQLASLVPALGFDFERFSLSAMESHSIASAEQRAVGALGWPALKHYYAGFFAAHAVLRSRGTSISKLERAQTDHLNTVMKIYDPSSPTLSPGMFLVAITDDTQNIPGEVTLSIKPYSNRGAGVHEAFWKEFCSFLMQQAATAVSNGAPDASDFVAKSDELSDAILKGGSTDSWLSELRNKINYQHSHDLWLPYRRSSEGYKFLSSASFPAANQARLDISKARKPVSAFVNVALYLTNLSLELSEFIAERSSKGGAFGQKWRRLKSILK